MNKVARGGHEIQSVDSIKFEAPRNFEVQNRAIIKNDYDRILLNENTDLQSVTAFGGELANLPTFGKVFIAVRAFKEQFVTAVRKTEIRESILDRTPSVLIAVMIDADFIHIIPTITCVYDQLKTTLTAASTVAAVKTAIDALMRRT